MIFATHLAGEIEAVAERNGEALLRRRVAALDDGERELLREALTRRPHAGRARTANRMSYPAVGGPNQVVSASAGPSWVRSPTQATYPSGRINTAAGAVTAPSAGSSHVPTYFASIN
jgi:hypothetical protein